ncbi:MAG: metal ABC transporter solute-binding protein, Zn/Mn family [Bacillota bacterium]
MRKKRYFNHLYIMLLTVVLLVSAASGLMAEVHSKKPTAALTIVPQKEMLNAVAEGEFNSVVMIPPGYSPANYAPTPAEIREFSEAKIYFSIGVPADIQNILPQAEEISDNIKIVKVFEAVDKKFSPRIFENDGRDPHIWLSPDRTAFMVEVMAEELANLMPEKEKFFMENADDYIQKIKEIDEYNKELLAEFKGEKILVYHPSIGYFADHYDLEMITIESHGKEPGPRQIQQIIEKARKENIKIVFYQSEIDSKKSQAIAEEIDGTVIQIDPLAENYLDNLKQMAEVFAETLSKRDDL